MSTTSKKPKILSTTNLTNLVKKRAHSADKASSSNRRAQQSNPELLTDSNILPTNPTTIETYKAEENITAEGYNIND